MDDSPSILRCSSCAGHLVTLVTLSAGNPVPISTACPRCEALDMVDPVAGYYVRRQMTRAETGPLRFGDDWTGAFIRGDNAIEYASAVRAALLCCGDKVGIPGSARLALNDLARALEMASHTAGLLPQGVQQLRPFQSCIDRQPRPAPPLAPSVIE